MSRIPIRSSFPNPLGDSSQKSSASSDDEFFGPVYSHDEFFVILIMALPITLGVFITLILTNTREIPEDSRTRQVILDVPETSRVDAQVTSGDNIVNFQNL